MTEENNKKTEDFLGGFSLRNAPPDLKEKILDRALQKRKTNHEMTTFLRKGFVGCLILLIIVIAVDATITRAQNRRFSSFLDEQQATTDKAEEEWSMLEDIIWEHTESAKSEAKIKFYDLLKKKKKTRRQPEWRESLEKEFE